MPFLLGGAAEDDNFSEGAKQGNNLIVSADECGGREDVSED